MTAYEPRKGDQLKSRYTLTEKLGMGGFAIAWLARDIRTGTDVAVKYPRLQRFGGINSDEKVHEGFQQEIDLLHTIRDVGGHSRIMQLLDSFTHKGMGVTVVELVDGEILETVVRNADGISSDLTRTMGIELCDIMSFLHENEIVYRDLKPDNVMQASQGKLKLIDLNAAAKLDSTVDTGDGSTEFGRSPFYPPEMRQSKYASDPFPLGPHTDVYSIGKFMFYLLACLAPKDDAVQPGDFGVPAPPYLSEIIGRATQEHPEDRYSNTLVLRRALKGKDPRPPPQARIHHLQGLEKGSRSTVSPGDTLGRKGVDPPPAIPIQDSNNHISAVQIQFNTDDNERWYISDRSTNGTYVNKGDGNGWQHLLSDRGRKKQHQQGHSPSADIPTEMYIGRGDVIALVHPEYETTFKFLA